VIWPVIFQAMADNPNKKGADAKLVSRQAWEYAPVKAAVKKAAPLVSDANIRQAFNEVKGRANPPIKRADVVAAVIARALFLR
jgi:hypothetical protein